MTEELSIAGKDKVDVFLALHNACPKCRRPMPREIAKDIVDQIMRDNGGKVSEVMGVPLYVNLSGDKLLTTMYDRHNGGAGTMQRVLREAGLLA